MVLYENDTEREKQTYEKLNYLCRNSSNLIKQALQLIYLSDGE